MIDKQENKLESTRTRDILPLDDLENLSADQDKLARFRLAEFIAEQVVNIKSFKTYSIDGQWGSGKSVTMRWVKDVLDAKHKNNVITIWFDAWQYESTGNIIYPLIAQLKPFARWKSYYRKSIKILKSIAVLGTTSIINKYSGIQLPSELNHQLAKSTDNLSALKNDFTKLINHICKSKKVEKVVFLIDNLDRCALDNIVIFLESIKIFLSTENATFILAIDKRVIAESIKVKYGNLTNMNGDEYLEKIIQFSFELPINIQHAVAGFIRLYSSIFNLLINLESVPRLFQQCNITSIRLIKKIFNRFIIIYKKAQSEHKGAFHPQLLFLFTFLYEFNPKIIQLQIAYQHDNLLSDLSDCTPFNSQSSEFSRRPIIVQEFIKTINNPFTIINAITEYRNSLFPRSQNDEENRNNDKKFRQEYHNCLQVFQEHGLRQT